MAIVGSYNPNLNFPMNNRGVGQSDQNNGNTNNVNGIGNTRGTMTDRIVAGRFMSQFEPPRFGVTSNDPVGERLATLLQAGRNVVSNHQSLFNDPARGDKNFDGDRLVEEATAMYEETWGENPVSDNLSERDRRLIEAQIDAMGEVIDEHKSQLDMEGVGFKGFIPALFGRRRPPRPVPSRAERTAARRP